MKSICVLFSVEEVKWIEVIFPTLVIAGCENTPDTKTENSSERNICLFNSSKSWLMKCFLNETNKKD